MSSGIIEHTELQKLADASMKTEIQVVNFHIVSILNKLWKWISEFWYWSFTDSIRNEFWSLQTYGVKPTCQTVYYITDKDIKKE